MVDSHVASGAGGEEELLSARLAPDMLPFSYQVKSVWTHSALAVERDVAVDHLTASPTAREGLDAFTAGRAPDFSPAHLAAVEDP